ncbi:hypothetical protein Hanom_Chr10g00923511 [Helianthus anomalus]
MYKERASWEKYRERLLMEARKFVQMKNKFLEEKASFEKEKKYEEWGRDGLKNKLYATEELLAKERQEWKKICENDNKRMYAACTKITNLEAEVVTLKGKVEEAQAARECVEDLTAKDVEIAELKCRLFEAHEKSESLEIDLVDEKVKADTAEEARKAAEEARNIITSALNVAQNNYAEAQSIMDTLVSESEWMRNHGVAIVTGSSSCGTYRCRACHWASWGYFECAQHVEEALGRHLGTRHCSVTDRADEVFSQVEEVYDHLSLPVMELVTEALKHDYYVVRLKSILTVQETMELLDEEEAAGDGGDE